MSPSLSAEKVALRQDIRRTQIQKVRAGSSDKIKKNESAFMRIIFNGNHREKPSEKCLI